MIRANFHVDPDKLTYEKWAELFGQAVWLETERLKNQAKMLAQLFGDKKNE